MKVGHIFANKEAGPAKLLCREEDDCLRQQMLGSSSHLIHSSPFLLPPYMHDLEAIGAILNPPPIGLLLHLHWRILHVAGAEVKVNYQSSSLPYLECHLVLWLR